jgi:hypothetical protein
MAPTIKDSGVTRMAGAPMFQAVQHPELDTLGQEAIRDFLKKRVRYLQLVAQNNKADGVNVTSITVVASIDRSYWKTSLTWERSTQNRSMTVRMKASWNILSLRKRDLVCHGQVRQGPKCWRRLSFTMSENNPALRVTNAVADYYSLHRNLKLDFINGKPKKAVEHLVSVIKPATLKALIESKLEMDKSELKKDFLEFVKYLEYMAIIHTRQALSCCGTQEDWRLWHEEQWQRQRRWQP